jgi:excisionase family DNA binding protein
MTAALLTTAEAAQRLRVSHTWLKKAAAARVVPCTRFGRSVRFSESDLADIIEAGRQRPAVSPLRQRRSA